VPIQSLNPAIPDWLEAVVVQLLAKNPADRVQSSAEVAERLACEVGARAVRRPQQHLAWVGWLSLLAGVLMTLGLLLAQFAPQGPDGQGSNAQESYWLRGDDKGPVDFQLYGPAAEECVRFEPTGARITLPGNYGEVRPFTGLLRTVNVKGDFEITVDFEILQE